LTRRYPKGKKRHGPLATVCLWLQSFLICACEGLVAAETVIKMLGHWVITFKLIPLFWWRRRTALILIGIIFILKYMTNTCLHLPPILAKLTSYTCHQHASIRIKLKNERKFKVDHVILAFRISNSISGYFTACCYHHLQCNMQINIIRHTFICPTIRNIWWSANGSQELKID